MYDRHRWLFAVCNMTASGPDLLQTVSIGILLGLACMVVRLGGHNGVVMNEIRVIAVGCCGGTVEEATG
jgi:hypothetical protein